MSDQKPEMIEYPEELLRVEKLIDDAKVNEAHELLDDFDKKEDLTLHDEVASQFLRVDLIENQGRYAEALNLARRAYDMSLGLGKNILSVDCLNRMANCLIITTQFDKVYDVIIQGEELLKTLTQVPSSERMKREAFSSYNKAIFYALTGKLDLFRNNIMQSLDLAEKSDYKRLNALILFFLARTEMDRRDLGVAFTYIKEGVTIAKESKSKYAIAACLTTLGDIYVHRGDWKRALKIKKESLSLFEEFDNSMMIMSLLTSIAKIYSDFTEDYDQASEYLEASLAVYGVDVKIPLFAGDRFYTAIIIALKKGDYEDAKKYLQNLKQMNSQVEDKYLDLRYRISKALVMKSSSRFHEMAEAEKILRQVVTEEILFVELMTTALVNLCDILLGEFRITNNLEILHELEPLITNLLTIAERTQSKRIQAETYVFQAKLALLTFDVKKSRRFLTQAQQIAERHNLNKLAQDISSEHKNLIDRLELWEQLRISESPVSERFELAQIGGQIKRMHRNLVVATQIIEEKVIISKEKKICLVCKGEVFGFSYACKCGANYCENCARAVSDLENVCWACETQIDYSKPVKLFNEEEEGVKIEVKPKKK
jgi:tetratricopeptide (TPR) repeat protein